MEVEEILNDLFGSLVFTKVDESNQDYAIYAAGIGSGLAGGKFRYVLLHVAYPFATKRQSSIGELNWKSLQTRELVYSYKMKSQSISPLSIPDVMLYSTTRTKEHTNYITNYSNYEILLLNDPKKKTQYQHHNKIYLSAALFTFSCVIVRQKPQLSQQDFFSLGNGNYELL